MVNILLLSVLLVGIHPHWARGTNVHLEDNAYTGLVIAIKPSVPESPALIDSIKSVLTDASEALFSATKKRAYFGEITILVPKTWTLGNYSDATDEKYDTADILVAEESKTYGHSPYTLQYGRCGEPGEYIHLTPEYLIDPAFVADFGDKGKVIAHEWAHLRWGIFDEYSVFEQEKFYVGLSGNAEATRCPLSYRGLLRRIANGGLEDCSYDSTTRLPEGDCQFIPYWRQQADLSASIMYGHTSHQVTTFCHSDESNPTNLHNPDAPNEQNRLCNRQSAWDVILKSQDFLNESRNVENPDIASTAPVFRVVQAKPERFVFVLDISPSMRDFNRYQHMRQAAELFISNFVADGVYVGIVQFWEGTTILQELRLVDSDESRQEIVEKLPTAIRSATGIGGGIRRGVEVLENGEFSVAGGNLIVLTDGGENRSPRVLEVTDEVIAKGVKVYSILLGITDANINTDLTDLSIMTGGKWFLANDAVTLSVLTDIFQDLSHSEDGNVLSESVHVSSSQFPVTPEESVSSSAAIDSSIGNRTLFAFSWSSGDLPPNVALKSPQSGCYYTNFDDASLALCPDNPISTVQANFQTLKFLIPGTAEVGKWEYNISTASEQDVTVTVTSTPSDANVYPVTVESGLSIVDLSGSEAAVVFAQVSQKFTPFLGARVTAQITTPMDNIVTKELYDSGSGADVRKNDGVYSRFFTEFDSEGRYSVKVNVVSDGSNSAGVGSASGAGFSYGFISDDGSYQANPNGLQNRPTQQPARSSVAGPLEREVSGGGLQFTGNVNTSDVYPPNQITDLSVSQLSLDDANAGVVVEFTAPGDDYDEGNSSRYEIRFTYGDPSALLSDFTDNLLLNQSDLLEGNISQPSSALVSERIVAILHSVPENVTSLRVAFAIRAFDDEENPSLPSNVVVLTFFIEPPPPAPTPLQTTTFYDETTQTATEETTQTTTEETTSSAKSAFGASMAFLTTILCFLGLLTS